MTTTKKCPIRVIATTTVLVPSAIATTTGLVISAILTTQAGSQTQKTLFLVNLAATQMIADRKIQILQMTRFCLTLLQPYVEVAQLQTPPQFYARMVQHKCMVYKSAQRLTKIQI